MITIRRDQGFIDVAAYPDFASIPGYVTDIDPSAVKLEAVVGNYLHAEAERCGLVSCHQPHNRGYLISTADGRITNIGKDCGKRHFGVDFERERKALDEDIRRYEYVTTVTAAKRGLADYRDRVAHLKGQYRGADWAVRLLKGIAQRGRLPDAVVDKVQSMVSRRSGAITESRLADEAEAEVMRNEAGRGSRGPFYVDVRVGTLEGIEALYEEHDLRHLLVETIGKTLADADAIDPDNATMAELARVAKRLGTLESDFEAAERSLAHARRLLERENILQLMQYTRGEPDKRALRKFAQELPIQGISSAA